MLVKRIVHPKMKVLLSSTHPQVVPNLYKAQKKIFLIMCFKTADLRASHGAPLTVWLHSSKYLPLCSAEKKNTFIWVWNKLCK